MNSTDTAQLTTHTVQARAVQVGDLINGVEVSYAYTTGRLAKTTAISLYGAAATPLIVLPTERIDVQRAEPVTHLDSNGGALCGAEVGALVDYRHDATCPACTLGEVPVHVGRTPSGDGWLIETRDSLTNAQAAALRWREEDPKRVQLGAFVEVHDADGIRCGWLSSATYHRRAFGPAYIECRVTLT